MTEATGASHTDRFRFYLREIGQGPKAGRNLSRKEAREAMELILSQQASPAQMGGFLLLQRYKGESPEELAGFAEAIRASARTIRPKVEGLLDVGSPYDGRKRSIVVSPASTIVAAAAGVPVVMHGESVIGPKFGVPVGDVLDSLGVETHAEPEEVQRSVEDIGFGFMRQRHFVPQMYALKDLRAEIALRSCLSTLEKIYNLAGAQFSVIGLTHLPYFEKMMATAQLMGFQRILIVQGIEGNEDAPTSRACRVFEWAQGETREFKLDPGEYDLQAATKEEMAGGDADHNASIAERILEGAPGGHRDLVCLNAGLRIYLTGRAGDIGEGIGRARAVIDSGQAMAKLKALRERRR